ncbi:MAG: hypothetical protein MK165_05765 [Pirellulaceae bacterium]|nr:hypothetical protein [Pirellulaceae bacterium]
MDVSESIEFLKEIDQRQDEILDGLENLNQRVELILEEWTAQQKASQGDVELPIEEAA